LNLLAAGGKSNRIRAAQIPGIYTFLLSNGANTGFFGKLEFPLASGAPFVPPIKSAYDIRLAKYHLLLSGWHMARIHVNAFKRRK